ncbi:MAG TPA: family 16 glycoside hydrolase, partial [Ktedonobacteraceae bacterium]|nr:family 16 glycoside hydrolase [Ktedonobacteraceae bacterium]
DANSPQSIYNQITSKSPTFEDPLDGRHTSLWDNQGNGDTDCVFTNGALHIHIAAKNLDYSCLAPGNGFSDFVFQVQMTIIKGYDAGIIFRANDLYPSSAYFFTVNYNGLYSLDVLYEGPQHGTILAFGRSPAIKVGLNQANLVSVMAHGKDIDLFINKQFVKRVQDETYAAGGIGLFANNPVRVPSDTAFNNAQVWNLP